jgi:diacylglycerol diphosphate phosphatase/phosphatidate phosphatase
MLDRCQPPPGIENPPLLLLNYTICTADHTTYEFKDGFKSFPSGHSSCNVSIMQMTCLSLIIFGAVVSFAGLGYLSFFLAGKMHLFDEGGVSHLDDPAITLLIHMTI